MHIDVIHKKTRKHVCNQCDKKFGWNASLQRHIDIVHNQVKKLKLKKRSTTSTVDLT